MHPVILILVSLLVGSFIATLSGWTRRGIAWPVGVVAILIAAGCSVALCAEVMTTGTVTYLMGGWSPPWGIVFVVDTFAAFMILVLTITALFVFVASRDEFESHFEERGAAFMALFLLATAGHIGIVATGDLFNLYVFIEVAALSGYALLGLGGGRSSHASLNYLIIGSFGASLYLLGVGYIYILTGTLNMGDLTTILTGMDIAATSHPVGLSMAAAVVLLFVGLWVKMALFPFHGWLPGAYTYSPPASASLLAPLTTKVMAYVLIRFVISVFSTEETSAFDPTVSAMPAVLAEVGVWLSIIAIFAGSVLAFTSHDQRRMLTYVVVAEVGYMVGGTLLGNKLAMTGAMLHVYADALMTVVMLLALSNITRMRGSLDLSNMRGLFGSMPFTMTAMIFGAMSMIGVPPFAGFFSKWYLLSGALDAGNYLFMAALIFSSLVNVIIFFRLFEVAFFKSEVSVPDAPAPAADTPLGGAWNEASALRTVPLMAAAVSLVVFGLASGYIVDTFISGVIPASL